MAAGKVKPPALNAYLTVGEAARLLGVSVHTLRHWDRAGRLTPSRHPLNGYRLYRREELEAVLEQAAVKGPRGALAGGRT